MLHTQCAFLTIQQWSYSKNIGKKDPFKKKKLVETFIDSLNGKTLNSLHRFLVKLQYKNEASCKDIDVQVSRWEQGLIIWHEFLRYDKQAQCFLVKDFCIY